ncbi:MarR family winged helix-turn-helix transcriptional regulator [Ponticoccus alexandrii]|uniref:MarR family winged helix-turn-helix transcriptional regulator n=1 Tax=Ponticoccus alexandrii TaxID=1943633 RepID=UPI0003D1A8F0|nr:hypothetical protein [Ponticoccus alexandrii]
MVAHRGLRATIGGVSDRLETKGLLSRKVSANDCRARVVHLTEEGEAPLQGFRPVVEAAQAEILGALYVEERQAFLTLAGRALGLEDNQAAFRFVRRDIAGPRRKNRPGEGG